MPYACPVCNKKFSNEINFNKHSKLHTGDLPLPPTCEKQTTRSIISNDIFLCSKTIDSNEHQQTLHSMENLNICHVCDEPFMQENLLKNHMKLHPDGEDFLCERNFVNFLKQGELCHGDPNKPDRTDEASSVQFVSCVSKTTDSGASSFDGDLSGTIDDGSANKLLDSLTSCSRNEDSSKEEQETDSFKLYGCGICCQLFSTKEETMHCFHSH